LLDRPGTDHAQVGEIIFEVDGTMQFFAINRDLLWVNVRKSGLNPGDETALDCFWVETCKYTIESIMGGDARRKREKCLKSRLFLVCNHGNFTKSIRTADSAADRHNDNFHKDVLFIVIFSVIGDGIEVRDQGEFRPVHTILLKRRWINGV
jgi:hypothetical protein